MSTHNVHFQTEIRKHLVNTPSYLDLCNNVNSGKTHHYTICNKSIETTLNHVLTVSGGN